MWVLSLALFMLMKSSALGTKELVSLDHSNFLALNFLMKNTVGWSKNPISSQTNKLMAGTKFSDYFDLNRYKKAKVLRHFIHLRLTNRPQILSTYHSISLTVNSRNQPKVCFSDVMHCQIRISETKMMPCLFCLWQSLFIF